MKFKNFVWVFFLVLVVGMVTATSWTAYDTTPFDGGDTISYGVRMAFDCEYDDASLDTIQIMVGLNDTATVNIVDSEETVLATKSVSGTGFVYELKNLDFSADDVSLVKGNRYYIDVLSDDFGNPASAIYEHGEIDWGMPRYVLNWSEEWEVSAFTGSPEYVVVFDVNDTTPPVTTHNYNVSEKHYDNVTIDFVCVDDNIGCDYTMVYGQLLKEILFLVMKDNILVNETITLHYYSVDLFGNVEETKNVSVEIYCHNETVYGDWSNWTIFNITHEERHRNITEYNVGDACGVDNTIVEYEYKERVCNETITYGDWSGWSSCVNGEQSRNRVVNYTNYNDTCGVEFLDTEIETISCSSGGSGGGSGGGSSGGYWIGDSANGNKSSMSWVDAVEEGVLKAFDGSECVIEVSFEFDEPVEGVSITLDDEADTEGMPDGWSKIYETFGISTTGFPETYSGEIQFKVSSDWLRENKAEWNTIRVLHESEDGWENIKPEKEGTDGEYYYFSVSVDSFSPFAVVTQEETENEQGGGCGYPIETKEEKTENDIVLEDKSRLKTVFTGVLILVAISGVTFLILFIKEKITEEKKEGEDEQE